MMKKAVMLLSGGIDSVTVMAIAKAEGYDVYPISFVYGQKHSIELEKAKESIKSLGIKNHKIVNLDLRQFGGSALTDNNIEVPRYNSSEEIKPITPVTYVPARNTIFLSMSLAYAEVIGAYDIFVGVHAQDYANYPDTRPEYIEAFEKMANLALGFTNESNKLRIQAPIINMTKAEIIKKGLELGVDYSHTISCYNASEDGFSCGGCLSCILRKKAFEENDIPDPTLYR